MSFSYLLSLLTRSYGSIFWCRIEADMGWTLEELWEFEDIKNVINNSYKFKDYRILKYNDFRVVYLWIIFKQMLPRILDLKRLQSLKPFCWLKQEWLRELCLPQTLLSILTHRGTINLLISALQIHILELDPSDYFLLIC